MVDYLWHGFDYGIARLLRRVSTYLGRCAMNYTPCGYKNYTKDEMELVGHIIARQYDFYLKEIWYSVKHKIFFVKYVSGDEVYDAQVKPDYFDLIHHRIKGGKVS